MINIVKSKKVKERKNKSIKIYKKIIKKQKKFKENKPELIKLRKQFDE